MVFKCFVPYCASGHKICGEKVTMFTAPRDEILLLKWNEAIRRPDRNITVRDHVCEKHFTIDQIKAKWMKLDPDSDVVYQMHNGKKSLKPGAIPNIFPFRRNELDQDERISSEPKRCTIYTRETIKKDRTELNCPTLSIKKEFPEPNEKENQSEFQEDFFEILWHNNITLPSDSWAKHVLHHPKSRAIVYCEISCLDNTITPLCTKQILIKEDMSVEVFILNRSVDVSVLLNMQNPKNTEELEEFLYRVDVLRVCIEGPTIKSLEDIPPEFGYKDISGRWRHNECPLLLNLDLKCEKCCSLYKPLFDKRKRKVNPHEESPAEKYKKHIDATKKIPKQLKNQILLKKLRGPEVLLLRLMETIEEENPVFDRRWRKTREPEEKAQRTGNSLHSGKLSDSSLPVIKPNHDRMKATVKQLAHPCPLNICN